MAYAQEAKLATFQESAQIIVDRVISQNVTASITLQTTSSQEFRISNEIEQKILEEPRISSIVFTNEESCVLGVVDQSCILVNVALDSETKGIDIQDSAKAVGNNTIGYLNKLFDTNTEFHSVFINTGNKLNSALETSGVVSGKGTISVVYTMANQDTYSAYEKMTALLLAKPIRDAGGFYQTAQKLSKEENSKMTIALIPQKSSILYQIKVSLDYPNYADLLTIVKPLELLKTQELYRSRYFSSAFYPLNSIIQIVILSKESITVNDIKGDIIPTEDRNGIMIPKDITNAGWIFDSSNKEKIEAKYIFGKKQSVRSNEISFGILKESQIENVNENNPGILFDQSILVLIIIIIAACGSIIYYLKGYRK